MRKFLLKGQTGVWKFKNGKKENSIKFKAFKTGMYALCGPGVKDGVP